MERQHAPKMLCHSGCQSCAGDTFKYVERCKASSWIAALGFSALMVVVGILIPTAAKFKLVRSLLPMPATGPSRQTMEKGFFHVSNHSEGITNAGVERLRVVCDFKVRLF